MPKLANTRYGPSSLGLIFVSLFVGQPGAAGAQTITSTPDGARHFIVWAHSDIQPRNTSERQHYELAIADVRDNLPPIDMAIVAGDIVQRHECSDDYEWFLATRSKARIPYWFEIAGNHDARNFALYFKYIRKPLYYSVSVGNLLLIFLSDEVNSSPTEISDSAFRWWRELVIENQDKNIITVTHAYLAQSRLFAHWLYRSKVLGSSRFADVLREHRVDIWLSGHTPAPAHVVRSENLVTELNGILFVNVSGIRKEYGIHTKSRLLVFQTGSPVVSLKLRDHEERAYVEGREIRLCLSHAFTYDGTAPRVSMPKGTVAPRSPPSGPDEPDARP